MNVRGPICHLDISPLIQRQCEIDRICDVSRDKHKIGGGTVAIQEEERVRAGEESTAVL